MHGSVLILSFPKGQIHTALSLVLFDVLLCYAAKDMTNFG